MAEWKWEREAMKGEPIPSGMNSSDVKCYVALRGIYAAYYAKQISREQATQDKAALMRIWESESGIWELNRKISELWKRIERPAATYRKDPTVENAQVFYRAVYNLEDRP